jgi:hypothetical protein
LCWLDIQVIDKRTIGPFSSWWGQSSSMSNWIFESE